MAHDIVIRGGQIVDGTGADPVAGDLAIDDGIITAVGNVDERGRREIDADGHVVTPGFVDIHTHLDAQIGWDPHCTPVSWHGVTTVMMGNCGVTFAPCKPTDRELLAGMMETVEDIPKDAILNGLPWDWEDYGSYLDAIERLNPGLNVAGLVGHCAVRFYVMGERAVEEQATEAEKKQMAEIVAKSIDAGAVGFSTNRFPPHVLPDGRSIPGTYADATELLEIAKVVGPRRALMQNVLDFTEFEFTTQLLRDLATTGGGRVLFSFGATMDPESGRKHSEYLAGLCAGGLDISAVTQPRGSGFVFGLQGLLPARGNCWGELRRMGFEGRLGAIRDPEFAARLVERVKKDPSKAVPPNQMFWMGAEESPSYTSADEKHLEAMAEAAGEHWIETWLRLSSESNGKALFTFRMFNQNIDALKELLQSPHMFPILGDAGAHVSQIMDAGWASFVLSHWVRAEGLFTMGEAIRRMTSGPARILGLSDRGLLKAGMKADVNVLDPATVAECQPEVVNDFPGGAPRFIQRARGYKATLVNGQVSVENGEHTGIRNGGVLRHQA
ncbi:MAG: amidohydrolase family protein [Candidatus Binatia bacterium]|nr:amidohydrolase family protein [Candidatus Binatia bacterium]